MDPNALRTIAASLLELGPDPALRTRLLRDVLAVPPADKDLVQSLRELSASSHTRRLRSEQRQDGSWGRFHSQDTSLKQALPTTESAVERAVNLGLAADHEILERAGTYLGWMLQDPETRFPDPPENNARWSIGVRLFSAATLALIQPGSLLIDPIIAYWSQVACRAFSSGAHDPAAEITAHRELSGLDEGLYYLSLNGKYQLALLSTRPGSLPEAVEKTLLSWLWHHPDGINYLGRPLGIPKPGWNPGEIDRWFASQELLSRFFSWTCYAEQVVNWLWEQRQAGGWWDFGPRSPRSTFLPLSESWRKKGNRQLDWSARVLCLLEKYNRWNSFGNNRQETSARVHLT